MPTKKQTVQPDTIVQVGKYYNVPCAAVTNVDWNGRIEYVPIIGHKHKDKQFGVDYEHYHIDGRFINGHNTYKVDDLGRTNSILSVEKHKQPTWRDYITEIVIKRRRAQRTETGLNVPNDKTSVPYDKWYRTMVGKSCKGKRCPHLGIQMVDKGTHLECALHKLIGNKETEKVIPREIIISTAIIM